MVGAEAEAVAARAATAAVVVAAALRASQQQSPQRRRTAATAATATVERCVVQVPLRQEIRGRLRRGSGSPGASLADVAALANQTRPMLRCVCVRAPLRMCWKCVFLGRATRTTSTKRHSATGVRAVSGIGPTIADGSGDEPGETHGFRPDTEADPRHVVVEGARRRRPADVDGQARPFRHRGRRRLFGLSDKTRRNARTSSPACARFVLRAAGPAALLASAHVRRGRTRQGARAPSRATMSDARGWPKGCHADAL